MKWISKPTRSTAFSLDSGCETAFGILGMFNRQADELSRPAQDELLRLQRKGGLRMNEDSS